MLLYNDLHPDLPCFYNDFDPIKHNLFSLIENEAHHALHVIRLKNNNPFLVSNGKGIISLCKVVDAKRNELVYIVDEIIDSAEKNTFTNSLAVASLNDSDRMEWLVEKAIELGVNKIYFFYSDHSSKKKIRLDRLQKIAISALKQSRKLYLPPISILEFDDLLKLNYTNRLYATAINSPKQHIFEITNKTNNLVVLGPEGDFSNNEISMFTEHKFNPCNLGSERLRTETAAIYALINCNLKR